MINLFCSFGTVDIYNKTLLEYVYSIKTIIRPYFLGSMQSKLMHTQSVGVDWTSQFKMEITLSYIKLSPLYSRTNEFQRD